MQIYKVAAAKQTQKQLQLKTLTFQHPVDQLTRSELRIRACYHKYLEVSSETLGWMMAIDASFFLEILQVYEVQEGPRVSSRMAHLVDHAGRKSAHHAILRDLVMLENQIPRFVLKKVLKFKLPALECAKDKLLSMFMGLCKELSPFKMNDEDMPNMGVNIQFSSCFHLLDFLYRLITPKLVAEPSEITKAVGYEAAQQQKGKSSVNSNFVKQFLKQITIPSVSDLSKSGVKFLAGGIRISDISFNAETSSFTLPITSLDGNTGVILRNLVAYEASSVSGPLVFTRYTELMNGIIDTEEDVKLLREKRIIVNHLKSDEEVANLSNGMSKSIRLTKVPSLDKVIADANEYYNGRWKVKMRKFLNTLMCMMLFVLIFMTCTPNLNI
ncbi:hypothetical protein RchiOBHm_Chr5g0046471 [Rosa chinensis]|uniref:Uncharacterized protein n=1 Tax=Rosa chinensis TaxID=74649 RepID=A0A2P6QE52_ROSCH|nr:hypothetical protein RchiOBHm_Chr5g0046471 [Rosa chinensis]